ncbi:hypothetical protein B0A55_11889, partial [Friedmanniomyces simplex]
MLVRSAGRRQRRHTSQLLAASFAQLNLPWLAPAQLRWSASQSASPIDTAHRRRQPDQPRLSQASAQVRRLATAADQAPASAAGTQYLPPAYSTGFKNSADQNTPWDFSANKAPERRDEEPSRLSVLRRTHDAPIIINSTTQDPAKLHKVQSGILGTSAELLQYLHTNLRVGRFTRVEAIIQRLSDQSAPLSPELLHAHTAYLEEQFRRLASHEKGSQEAKKALGMMSKWIEVDVRSKGIDPSARMLVVMVRGTLRAMDGTSRKRAITRYLDWAETLGNNTLVEVLESEDYDDDEYAILGPVTAEYYEDANLEGHEISAEGRKEMDEAKQDPYKFYRRQEQVDLNDLPAVYATPQKGNSLLGVKRAMQTFIDLPQSPPDASPEEQRARAFERQRQLEETSVEIAVQRWREADEELRKIGISTAMQGRPMGAMMWQWYRTLLPALEAEYAEVKKRLNDPVKGGDDERHHYGPFMELLPLDKMAANAILWVMA